MTKIQIIIDINEFEDNPLDLATFLYNLNEEFLKKKDAKLLAANIIGMKS